MRHRRRGSVTRLTRRRGYGIRIAVRRSLEVNPGPWQDACPRSGACRSSPASSCAMLSNPLRYASNTDDVHGARLGRYYLVFDEEELKRSIDFHFDAEGIPVIPTYVDVEPPPAALLPDHDRPVRAGDLPHLAALGAAG